MTYANEQELLENIGEDTKALYLKNMGFIPTTSTKPRPDTLRGKSKRVKIEAGRTMSHAEFQRQVIDYAKIRGWAEYHTWKSVHSPSGFPDLFLCRPPQIAIIELKVGKDKLTESQEKWAKLFFRCPQINYYTFYPEDWDGIVEELK